MSVQDSDTQGPDPDTGSPAGESSNIVDIGCQD